MRSRYLPLALFAILLLATEATADKLWTPYDRPEQYSVVTDQDVPIVMRDGVTLYADVRRGNRPGFTDAAPPEIGERLVDAFCSALGEHGIPVVTGRFPVCGICTL